MGCILLAAGLAGAADAPLAEGPPAMPGPAPAEPHVVVESAWLVPREDADGVLIVAGPRPAEAAEALLTVRFRYEGDAPAAGLRIVVAIPAGMALVAGSATGPGAVLSYSADGGANFGDEESLTVAAAGGAPGATRPATAADFTHVRWDLPGEHPPGIAGLVSFRARPVEAAPGEDAT